MCCSCPCKVGGGWWQCFWGTGAAGDPCCCSYKVRPCSGQGFRFFCLVQKDKDVRRFLIPVCVDLLGVASLCPSRYEAVVWSGGWRRVGGSEVVCLFSFVVVSWKCSWVCKCKRKTCVWWFAGSLTATQSLAGGQHNHKVRSRSVGGFDLCVFVHGNLSAEILAFAVLLKRKD